MYHETILTTFHR